jgi:hypothetical protein
MMVTVAKNGFESILRRQRPSVRRQRVANIAGADLAFRRMTAIAIGMRSDTRRNCLTRVALAVTRRTAIAGPAFAASMGFVVEFHIKALDKSCGKYFHWRIIRVQLRMADRAHCAILVIDLIGNELIHVTANA